MPYENKHAARLRDPGDFASIVVLWEHDGIQGLGGPLKSKPEEASELESIHFDASKWTVDAAKKWLEEHNYKPILFEPAKAKAEGILDIKAGADPAAPRIVTGTAYSGGMMRLPGWKYPVVVDLSGLTIPETVPLLAAHENTVGSRLGTVRVRTQGSEILIEGQIEAGNQAAAEIVAQAQAGAEWQLSIGAEVQQTEFVRGARIVNGVKHAGPFYHVTKAVLREISVLPCGADRSTRLAVAAGFSLRGGPDMDFEKWLESKGFKLDVITDEQKAVLRAAFDAEQKPPEPKRKIDQIIAEARLEEKRQDTITAAAATAIGEQPAQLDLIEKLAETAIEAKWTPEDFELKLLRALRPVGRTIRRQREEVVSDRVIEAALCMAGGLGEKGLKNSFNEQELDAAHKRWNQGLSLQELLLRAARQRGFEAYSCQDVQAVLRAAFAPGMVQAAGFSTISLPGIMAATANKFLAQGFNSVEAAWRRVCSIRPVNDFKTVTSYALTGDFKYKKVPPGGELQHAGLDETGYTNKADTYGRLLSITRTDIINDDLGALTRVPRMHGRGAALAFNEVFWTEFLSNNTTFFASGHKNLSSGAGSALSIAGGVAAIAAAEILFKDQTDPNGNPLGVLPRIILVPTALDYIAKTLMKSSVTGRDDEGVTGNVYEGAFEIVCSAYLSNSKMGGGYSTAYWYMGADPQDLSGIEVAFLNGKEQPTIESADADFATLGVQMRGYHDFGANQQEYRAWVRSDGA
jgi:phage major head subunit gpT-like protein